MLRTSAAVAVALLALLVLPGFTSTMTVGFRQGDSAVFAYDMTKITLTTDPSTNDIVNQTTTQYNQLRLDVLSVNLTNPTGKVAYRETVTVYNATTLTTPSVGQNFTAIFDPYDNATFLGKIGWYPFTYADLPAGNRSNVEVAVSISGYPGNNGSTIGGTVIARVNFTVTRNHDFINVSCRVNSGPSTNPWTMAMRYNATTGMLDNFTEVASFLGTTRILTYQLLAYSHPSVFDYTPILQAVLYIAIAAVALLAVYEVLTRKSRRERKAARLRERLRTRR